MASWKNHLKQTRRENPGMKLGQLAKLASRTYQRKGGQRSQRSRRSRRQGGRRQSRQRGGADVQPSESIFGADAAAVTDSGSLMGGRRRRRRRSRRQ